MSWEIIVPANWDCWSPYTSLVGSLGANIAQWKSPVLGGNGQALVSPPCWVIDWGYPKSVWPHLLPGSVTGQELPKKSITVLWKLKWTPKELTAGGFQQIIVPAARQWVLSSREVWSKHLPVCHDSPYNPQQEGYMSILSESPLEDKLLFGKECAFAHLGICQHRDLHIVYKRLSNGIWAAAV